MPFVIIYRYIHKLIKQVSLALAFLFGGIHMNLLNGFDSYMIYKLLANLFHTSIEQVYWSLTVGGLIVVVIIFAIYYLVGRGFK